MKKNDNKSFFSPVLLGMYLGAIASICADRYVTKKKEVEMQNYLMEHCYTHGGRSFISSLEDYNFSLNDLYIVKYGRQYYLTNQNLKKLGSELILCNLSRANQTLFHMSGIFQIISYERSGVKL